MPSLESSKLIEGMPDWTERIRERLALLRESINNDPGITQQPKLNNGAAVFRYKNMGREWEIVTRKEKNGGYSVRVKKWVKLQNGEYGWQTQKNGNENMFKITANDKNTFNRGLGAVLDKTIGKNRDRLPKTGGIVYTMLNNTTDVNKNESSDNNNNGNSNKRKTSTSNMSATNNNGKVEKKNNVRSIKEKPLNLSYTERNKEKKVSINLPSNQYSVEGRVTRCLRWANITDAVEDRYKIPRGLLMALMAQEGRGDPTVINQKSNGKCDGGAGLIHMQAINASNFGLKTLPRSNDDMIDYKHGKRLQKAKSDTKNDLKKLSKLDDRFNPVLSVDASARFLLNEYNNLPQDKRGTDRRLHAVNKYAGRGMQDYGYSVVVYRTTINSIRNNSMPKFTNEIEKVKKGEVSANVNKTREKTNLCISRTKEAIRNLSIKIDNKPVTYQEYLNYQKGQCDNYGLADYSKFNKEHPYKS